MLTRLWTVCLVLGVAGATRLEAADMVARDVAMVSGTTSDVLVDGALSNESTFGLTVFVELSPRAGAVGTLTFTPAPSADVQQIDDPWPGDGTFTGYDTDLTGSLSLNGSGWIGLPITTKSDSPRSGGSKVNCSARLRRSGTQ